VRVLGPIEVAGEPLSPRLCRLIAALAAAPGTVVPVDQLAEAVWAEDQPKNAEAALHNLVARLRARLPGEAIVTRPPGYLLAAPTDAAEFEALTAKGRFSEALALWRGPAFAGVDVPAAEAEAARLEELRLGAVPPYGADADRLAAVANGLAERLGADRFARAGRRGAAMPADAVIAYADTALSAVAKR